MGMRSDTHTSTMMGSAVQSAKVLPCGHIYHLGCLRDWLQQSGTDNFTCPICRTPLFVRKAAQPGKRSQLYACTTARKLAWIAHLCAAGTPRCSQACADNFVVQSKAVYR